MNFTIIQQALKKYLVKVVDYELINQDFQKYHKVTFDFFIDDTEPCAYDFFGDGPVEIYEKVGFTVNVTCNIRSNLAQVMEREIKKWIGEDCKPEEKEDKLGSIMDRFLLSRDEEINGKKIFEGAFGKV